MQSPRCRRSLTISNKEQHHEWCRDLQKETTTQTWKQKTIEPWTTRFIDGHQKQGWVGAGDSFVRRMADVAESFVNRRVQFYQLFTYAAQIMSDNNRDDEQVKLHSLQAQTRHMNKAIESVNFSAKNVIVLVTHISIVANSAWPSLSGLVQPVTLMATVLLLLTDIDKQDLFQHDRRPSQSPDNQPADYLVINRVVRCHYIPLGVWLPFRSQNVSANYTAEAQAWIICQRHCYPLRNDLL